MNVINMPTGELIPYENNTKIHPPEQVDHIANSIKRFGWQQPIVIDKNKVVIIGHGRLLAAKQMGLQEVPVVYADDLSEEDAQALRLADNKLNESPWDMTKLEEELAQLAIDGIDMSQFGFDEEVLDWDSGTGKESEKTEVTYFSNEEIKQEIVNGWQFYSTVEQYAEHIIDKASAMYQFNRLCQGYDEGYNISLLFNPHRLDTRTNHKESVFWAWNNAIKYRENFARYLVEVGGKVPIKQDYYKHIGLGYADYQYVNEFQPYMARDIYKKYCKDGDKILNPCAGWGGRLLGFASCLFENAEYVETDPATETYKGLVKLKQFLRLGDNVKQYNLPFEELDVKENYFDFVFTSPPYFDTEHYSTEENQSYLKYNNYEKWKSGFLLPMIEKILYCMKKGGKCLLNVGNCRYSIDTDIEEYLDGIGIQHERIKDFKIGGAGIGDRTGEDGEPFILFEK